MTESSENISKIHLLQVKNSFIIKGEAFKVQENIGVDPEDLQWIATTNKTSKNSYINIKNQQVDVSHLTQINHTFRIPSDKVKYDLIYAGVPLQVKKI